MKAAGLRPRLFYASLLESSASGQAWLATVVFLSLAMGLAFWRNYHEEQAAKRIVAESPVEALKPIIDPKPTAEPRQPAKDPSPPDSGLASEASSDDARPVSGPATEVRSVASRSGSRSRTA